MLRAGGDRRRQLVYARLSALGPSAQLAFLAPQRIRQRRRKGSTAQVSMMPHGQSHRAS